MLNPNENFNMSEYRLYAGSEHVTSYHDLLSALQRKLAYDAALDEPHSTFTFIAEVDSDGIVTELTTEEVYARLGHLLGMDDNVLAKAEAAKDQAYKERNHLVAALARLYPSGIRATEIPGWDPEWSGCVYIDLPDNRQISYHYHDSEAFLFEDLPPYKKPYDGHRKEDVHDHLQSLWKYSKLLSLDELLHYIQQERRKASNGTALAILQKMEKEMLTRIINKSRGLPE